MRTPTGTAARSRPAGGSRPAGTRLRSAHTGRLGRGGRSGCGHCFNLVDADSVHCQRPASRCPVVSIPTVLTAFGTVYPSRLWVSLSKINESETVPRMRYRSLRTSVVLDLGLAAEVAIEPCLSGSRAVPLHSRLPFIVVHGGSVPCVVSTVLGQVCNSILAAGAACATKATPIPVRDDNQKGITGNGTVSISLIWIAVHCQRGSSLCPSDPTPTVSTTFSTVCPSLPVVSWTKINESETVPRGTGPCGACPAPQVRPGVDLRSAGRVDQGRRRNPCVGILQ